MKTQDLLAKASDILAERGEDYGPISKSFRTAAIIASAKLNMDISAYIVATVMESVKDARLAETPTHLDSYIDKVNYAAIRGELVTEGISS